MKNKKFLAAFISAAMAVSSVPVGIGTAAADEALTYGDYITYERVDADSDGTADSVCITSCDASADIVEIPMFIDDLPVKSIAEYAFS